MRPQRWQPIRLLCPQDSPGNNAGVGCHFLILYTYIHIYIYLHIYIYTINMWEIYSYVCRWYSYCAYTCVYHQCLLQQSPWSGGLTTQVCPTLCNPMDWGFPVSSSHGIFQARILEETDCHFLLQGIVLTQGSNPGLLHCRQTLSSEPPRKVLTKPLGSQTSSFILSVRLVRNSA